MIISFIIRKKKLKMLKVTGFYIWGQSSLRPPNLRRLIRTLVNRPSLSTWHPSPITSRFAPQLHLPVLSSSFSSPRLSALHSYKSRLVLPPGLKFPLRLLPLSIHVLLLIPVSLPPRKPPWEQTRTFLKYLLGPRHGDRWMFYPYVQSLFTYLPSAFNSRVSAPANCSVLSDWDSD